MLVLIINPIVLISLCVLLGILFGNIRLGRFSFSTSGSMFVGIVVGWLIIKYIHTIEPNSEIYSTAQNILSREIIDKGFFDLFLILFIASVGLLAARDVGRVIKKYGIKFILMGFLITFLGAATTYCFSLLNPVENPYLYTGVYTGALTSSPGLGAALETARLHSTELADRFSQLKDSEKKKILNIINYGEKFDTDSLLSLSEEQKNIFIKNSEVAIGTGYAVGYPFGVIIVIFAMNFFPVIFKINTDKEKLLLIEELGGNKTAPSYKEKDNNKAKEVYFDLSAFSLVCLIGYVLGIIKITFYSFGEISLGSTGGVLIAALILGHIGNIGLFCFRMNNRVLGVIRTISLAYFFAVIGLRYGYRVINSLSGPGLFLVIASLFIGSIAMIMGFLVGRYLFKINWIMLSGAICGGMTSTPGLGAAVDAVGSDEPAAGYGAVYPFALLGMVFFSILLNHIL
ncbi:MAG: hypothetical protein PHI72_08735 [Atribacterota bacterium]|nr:hypothetical protein [Atribacterota bacterium]MDD5637842.1 hypothetical protein [Atribacterota bacterium]